MAHQGKKDLSIFDTPAYSVSETARILNLPIATVKAWCFGQNYRSASGERKFFQPVIQAASSKERLLSFVNLCELHVLSAIRRHHKITLPKVRESVEYVRSQLGSSRPLVDREFKTNGIDLFVKHAKRLLNVSRKGQEALRGEFELALARIERDQAGTPIRLFPFSRTKVPSSEQPRAVVVDPRLSFGRPVLSKVAIPTDIIVDRFRAGDSLTEMAKDYGVEEEEIEEALRFEQRRAA
jgi:uncharacterized protein (DUF433 family)